MNGLLKQVQVFDGVNYTRTTLTQAYTNYNFLDSRGVPKSLAAQKIISGEEPATWKNEYGVDLVFSACPDEVARTAEV